jgi:hypothetical protein
MAALQYLCVEEAGYGYVAGNQSVGNNQPSRIMFTNAFDGSPGNTE